jgi:hypothetical protein
MKLLNLKKDQTDLCLTENILSDKDTTCSVRLNRESSYGRIAARRSRCAVVRRSQFLSIV